METCGIGRKIQLNQICMNKVGSVVTSWMTETSPIPAVRSVRMAGSHRLLLLRCLLLLLPTRGVLSPHDFLADQWLGRYDRGRWQHWVAPFGTPEEQTKNSASVHEMGFRGLFLRLVGQSDQKKCHCRNCLQRH